MNKQHIDRSFSLASANYDDHASIQRRIGETLLHGLSDRLMSQSYDGGHCRVLDAGCGTGYFTEPLMRLLQHWQSPRSEAQATTPGRLCMALDRSAGMLGVVEKKQVESGFVGGELARLQADLESLPLRSAHCDVIFSNLAMQWLEQPSIWLNEAVRVLRPGGWLACSTLLPGSLNEIQTAWSGLDDAQHVNRFETLESLQALLPGEAMVARQHFREFFASAIDAMKSVKAVGAHTILHGARQQLTTPGRMKAVLSAYENQRKPEGVPLSYEAAFIYYQKSPAARPTS